MSTPMKIGFALLLASLLCLALATHTAPVARAADGASADSINSRFFRLEGDMRRNIPLFPRPAEKERDIQKIFEDNLKTFLGVRFVASEYTLSNRKRIDSIGLDMENRPVIIEYKKKRGESIIKQALRYRRLLDEKDNRYKFEQRTRKKLALTDAIDWRNPRVICVAAEFDAEDKELARDAKNLELIRYRLIEKDAAVHLEWLAGEPPPVSATAPSPPINNGEGGKNHPDHLTEASGEQKARLDSLLAFFRSLGDDVTDEATVKYHKVMHQPPNAFATFVLTNSEKKIAIGVYRNNLSQEEVIKGFTEDVSGITVAGAWLGRGRKVNYRITILSDEDLERAKPLLRRAYEEAKQ